ncbi:DNA methyltransferase [Paremcibacter congregatus]|uniref:site-specific DNA-methyltransferase (adenine-specific) n=2 Tax=Paremcibacter congregatus TaxID=2043170 RepID=A0A2G4YWL8_9PROT|nr:DNA methyltransferase [Paremcibacter congregatus]QDE29239.1 DNA adenine methylase [Paremcibacter congregatus]
MSKFYTPLRYPGGKGRLTNYIAQVMKLNDLQGGSYIEPYAGGAGIAIELLVTQQVSHIHLNDLNGAIYAFWHSVLHQPDELCSLISDTQVNMENWFLQKEIIENPSNYSILELGFATFFLNRTNRSGIIFNGGVIGGKQQTGNWKIDARFNKPGLIGRIKEIQKLTHRISLTQLDASDFVSILLPTMPKKSLVYFDPPYFVKGQGLYQNHYNPDDHKKIAGLIQSGIKQTWLVSYDNAPEICKLYKKRRQLEFSLNYSAQLKYKGTEVMIFKDKMTIPDQKSPLNVAA